ncbi:hypothetical protein MSAN_01870500 [Mycena sanguinolenta]|uniref:ABM domain-containing protein n=1 Tax=Mycena sanguinolenta TaxID=230812 RepID=A0A8H6XTR1_9AGAR|nr:hypothetical protein MSAN_01870500 [Mycena sanguinolenta]
MPSIQIAHFPVSDTFVSNPDIFKAPLDIIKGAEGHKGSYYGLQIEDKKTGYFVSVWDSYEAHQKVIKDPNYAGIIEALKPAVSGPFERHHINVSSDPTAALTAPAVEFVVFTLKDGAADKLTPLMEELGAGADTAAGAHPPCAWGQSVEDKNKFLLVIGWDTVQAHWDAVKEGTALHGIVVKIKEFADLWIGHSHMKKHEV